MRAAPGIQEEANGLRRLVYGKRPSRTILRLALWVVFSFFLFRYVLVPIQVRGISMEPTYRDGQYSLVNRLAYRWSPPQRGDVVALRIVGQRVMLMKRIIGLPGEKLSIRRSLVFINGEALPEPYARRSVDAPWRERERLLGPDEYYVIGDNRTMRQGDHEYGVQKQTEIAGKVLF
jgi:signal peptidase I